MMARNKFNAKKTWRDGHWFDSKWEADRYSELMLLQRAGEISHLFVKPDPFDLAGGYINPRTGRWSEPPTYQVDFSYTNKEGFDILEDAKGVRTSSSVLKRKIVESRHNVIIWFAYRDGRRE